MNMNAIKKFLDVLNSMPLFIPLVIKEDFFGIKIPILYPITTMRKNVEIDLETLEKFKIIDRGYKHTSPREWTIFLKLVVFSVLLFFICFFYFFKESLSEFDPLYIRVLYTLAAFWVCFFWMICLCGVEVTSQGIFYRRFLDWHFVEWKEIQDVTQTSIFTFPKCCIVILKNKKFLNKFIIFLLPFQEGIIKKRIEEVTKYIKYKIENLEGS